MTPQAVAEQPRVVSAREYVIESIHRMPESATLEEIADEVAVLVALRKGIKAGDAGEVSTQDEVLRRSERWLGQ